MKVVCEPKSASGEIFAQIRGVFRSEYHLLRLNRIYERKVKNILAGSLDQKRLANVDDSHAACQRGQVGIHVGVIGVPVFDVLRYTTRIFQSCKAKLRPV